MEFTLFVNGTSFDIDPRDSISRVIKHVIESIEDTFIENYKFNGLRKYLIFNSTRETLSLDIPIQETDLVNGDELFYKLMYPLSDILYSLEHLDEVKRDPFALIKLNPTIILVDAMLDNRVDLFDRIKQTQELCCFAYSKNKAVFPYIKNEFKTREICEEYFNELYNSMVKYIDNSKCENKDQFYRRFINLYNEFIIGRLYKIPLLYLNNFARKIACVYARLINKLPIEIRSRSFYVCLTDKNFNMISFSVPLHLVNFLDDFIPQEFIEDFCIALVRKKRVTFEDLPRRYKTKNVCLEAVERDGDLLQFVPDSFKTFEICMVSIRQNPRNRFLIPKSRMTKELKQAIDEILA